MDLELPSPRDVRAAMASSSPAEQYDNPSGGSGYVGLSENGKSPLSMSLGFLKNLTEKKTTRSMLLRLSFLLGSSANP